MSPQRVDAVRSLLVRSFLLPALSVLLFTDVAANALTPTPTPTPCVDYGPARIEVSLSIDPPAPVVGDAVRLTFAVRNTGYGLAGIPSYGLVGGEYMFKGDRVPATTGATLLGSETVVFHLRAAQPGAAQVGLSVHYETATGCVSRPVYFFTYGGGGPFPVMIEAGSCDGDCNSDSVVAIDELQVLVNVALGRAALADCREGDADGDGGIHVDDILLAVDSVLDGCPLGLPDLLPTSATMLPCPGACGPTRVRLCIDNAGDTDAAAFQIWVNSVVVADVAGLTVGGEVCLDAVYPFPPFHAADAVVIADLDDRVAEVDEHNNALLFPAPNPTGCDIICRPTPSPVP